MAKRRSVAVRRTRTRYVRSTRIRRRPKFTLPMAVVGGFVPTFVGIWNRRSSAQAMGDYIQQGWTGIGSTGRFSLDNLRLGAIPALAGFVVHMVASKLGINRALGRARIPLLRV